MGFFLNFDFWYSLPYKVLEEYCFQWFVFSLCTTCVLALQLTKSFVLSYDLYGPARAFFAKPLMRVVRIYASGAGKSRTALLQKRTATHVKTSRKFVSKLAIMITYLLTKLSQARWENIWLSVIAHGPRCARSICHDLEPIIFPFRPPTLSISI